MTQPTPTRSATLDLDELENVIKQALPMTMRNESPCEARVALLALLAELRALRAMRLAVHELAVARIEGLNQAVPIATWVHDMTEIERLTRD